MLDAEGNDEPGEAAEVEHGQNGAGHVCDRFFGVPSARPADGGEDHREDDDKRQRRGGDVLEPGELRHEGVDRQQARSEAGEEAVGLDVLGDEEAADFCRGEWNKEDEQKQKPDAGQAILVIRGFDPSLGVLLDPVVEIEQAEEGSHHQGAVSESLAERLLHGQVSAGIMRILGGLAMEWAS